MIERPSLQEINIAQLFKKIAKQYPARNALMDDTRTLTYAQLDKLTDDIAKGVLESGVGKSELCGLFCMTSFNAIVYFYALLKAGTRVLMLPEKVAEAELDNYMDIDELKSLFSDGVHYDQFGEFCYFKNMKNKFIVEDEDRDGWLGINHLCEIGNKSNIDIEEYIDGIDCHATSVMLFTSGTTGKPKIVLSSGYSRANGGMQQSYDQHMSCEDVVMEALPMYHCFAMQVNILSALAAGASIFVPRDRHSVTIIEGLYKHKCNVLTAVPALYKAIIANPKLKEYDIHLRTGIIGGGTYTPKSFCEIEESLGNGFTLMSSLGMTEGTAGITVCEMDDTLKVRSETIGHFMAYIDGKIIDPKTGKECDIGKEGEICFKGYNVMQGYYQNEEATKSVIDENGYLHSGDLGYMDEVGNIHMSGRIKDIIIRAGDNISPAEIEKVLYDDPRIDSSKVVGVKDDHYGEIVYAVVVPKTTISEDEVKGIVAAKLIPSKVPSGVVFLNELPLSANGKVNVMECKRLAQEKADKK